MGENNAICNKNESVTQEEISCHSLAKHANRNTNIQLSAGITTLLELFLIISRLPLLFTQLPVFVFLFATAQIMYPSIIHTVLCVKVNMGTFYESQCLKHMFTHGNPWLAECDDVEMWCRYHTSIFRSRMCEHAFASKLSVCVSVCAYSIHLNILYGGWYVQEQLAGGWKRSCGLSLLNWTSVRDCPLRQWKNSSV